MWLVYFGIGAVFGGYWFGSRVGEIGPHCKHDVFQPVQRHFVFCFFFVAPIWPFMTLFHLGRLQARRPATPKGQRHEL